MNQSGLGDEIVQMAIDAGLIRPLTTDANRFDIDTLSMLKAGVGLLNSGLPFDELVQLAVRHAQHVESVAEDAVALFAQHLTEKSDSSQTETVETIVPLVTELVAQHFRQTLIEHVGRHLVDETKSL